MAAEPKGLRERHVLDQAMDERRADLELHWTEVATRAGMTKETLRQVRRGTGGRDAMQRRKVERALAWEKGSLDAVERGERATPDREAEEQLRLGPQAGVANAVPPPGDKIEIDRETAEQIADALMAAARALRGENPDAGSK